MNKQKQRKAAVLIHGFLGNARIFDFLLPTLRQQGRTLITVSLPGHGADLPHFCRHHRTHWQQHVDRRLRDIAAQYEDVVIVTHSMGGLLTVCSSELPQNARIFALALPLRLRMTPSAMLTNFRVTLPVSEREPQSLKAARAMLGVRGITPFNAVRLLPNTAQLVALAHCARKRLTNGFENPITAVWSDADGVVSPRSKKHLSCSHLMLRKSKHFDYDPTERTQIIAELRRFLGTD